MLAGALAALILSTAACSGAGNDAKSPTGFELNTVGSAERIEKAGLEILPAEGDAEHFHAHLDIFWNGKTVPVPADIGISIGPDGQAQGISALHTHDDSGIIHVEAPTVGQVLTLGQLFTQWGIMGGRDSEAGSGQGTLDDWKAYVNGASYEGILADMKINPNDQISLVFGEEPESVPSSYTFPEGLGDTPAHADGDHAEPGHTEGS